MQAEILPSTHTLLLLLDYYQPSDAKRVVPNPAVEIESLTAMKIPAENVFVMLPLSPSLPLLSLREVFDLRWKQLLELLHFMSRGRVSGTHSLVISGSAPPAFSAALGWELERLDLFPVIFYVNYESYPLQMHTLPLPCLEPNIDQFSLGNNPFETTLSLPPASSAKTHKSLLIHVDMHGGYDVSRRADAEIRITPAKKYRSSGVIVTPSNFLEVASWLHHALCGSVGKILPADSIILSVFGPSSIAQFFGGVVRYTYDNIPISVLFTARTGSGDQDVHEIEVDI